MKKLLLFAATLLPTVAAADNYFVDGACWTTEISGNDGTDGTPYCHLSGTKICGDTIIDGVSALKVYDDYNLTAIIRVDGDKVYTLSYNGTGYQWRLAYDFSLKEGDFCEIGRFNGYCQITPPHIQYFKYV